MTMYLYLSLKILVLLGLIHLCRSNGDIHWDYSDGEYGPDNWKNYFPLCGGDTQSPIDIEILSAHDDYQFTPFQFSPGYDSEQTFTLTNNGHSIQAVQTNNNGPSLQLTGGDLNGEYEFVNFHLHWGENDSPGSEHLVDGERYSGEIHFVHKNQETNTTAVLGMFLQSSSIPTISQDWTTFFDNAKLLQEEDESNEITISLSSLMSTNFNIFWRYNGSLTTPPCTPGVIWTVFQQPIDVDDVEFHNFRPSSIPKNHRPPQPLNDRTVDRSLLSKRKSIINILLQRLFGKINLKHI